MSPRKRGFGLFVVVCTAITSFLAAQSPTVGKVQQLAPDVYFYEGDISKGHCNNGWIIFEDYVLVKNPRIARYVGDDFPGQVGKVYTELTGRTLPDRQAELDAERTHIAWHHGHAHAAGR